MSGTLGWIFRVLALPVILIPILVVAFCWVVVVVVGCVVETATVPDRSDYDQ